MLLDVLTAVQPMTHLSIHGLRIPLVTRLFRLWLAQVEDVVLTEQLQVRQGKGQYAWNVDGSM